MNFTPDYPGVDDDADDTAPSRHHVEGTVTRAQGRRGTISGTITTVLCVPGPDGAQTESPHAIVWHFKAAYVLAAPNDLHIYGGFQFSPTESTGTFRDLRGGGRIEGRFTCLGLASCAPGGEFTDFVVSTGDPTLPAGQLRYGATGTYSDPTVLPVG